jgi:hypothetical protein
MPPCIGLEQRRLMSWRPAMTVLSTQRSDSQRRHRPQPVQGVGRECRRVRHGDESSRLGAAQEVMRSGGQTIWPDLNRRMRSFRRPRPSATLGYGVGMALQRRDKPLGRSWLDGSRDRDDRAKGTYPIGRKT